MKSWFAIYVRSKQEQKVFERLGINQITSFLPKIEVYKSYSDRNIITFEVLFKSYVFVKINLSQMMKVLDVVGVVNFVKFEGKAVSIPDYQILAIKKYIKGERVDLVNQEEFLLGQEVEILKGPFKEKRGRLLYVSQRELVVMELEALNRYIPLKIQKSFLKIL